MNNKYKNILIVIFVSFLFFNFSFAKEIRSRFGFYIDIPNNFVFIQDQNINDLMNESDNDINKEFFNDMMSGTSKQDLNVEFYFPKNLNAEFNSININVQSGVTLKEIKNDFRLIEICKYYQQLFSDLFERKIEQYECNYSNDFRQKYPDVIRTKHDSVTRGNFMIQYQFDQKRNLITLTIGCEPKNCNYMEKVAVGMIRSIN
jgi:hypothetical protein